MTMTGVPLSANWILLSSKYIHDLTPARGLTSHYAADECWCHANKLTLHHYQDPKRDMEVWVHTSGSDEARNDMQNALDKLVAYYDGIYHL